MLPFPCLETLFQNTFSSLFGKPEIDVFRHLAAMSNSSLLSKIFKLIFSFCLAHYVTVHPCFIQTLFAFLQAYEST